MKVTVQGEYALKLVLHLASQSSNDPVKIGEVARRQRIPFKFLQQTARKLVHARILTARRGPDGGVSLARSPERISVGDVIRAVEGGRSGIYCLSERGSAVCPHAHTCPLKPLWQRIQRDIARAVDTTTFDQLASLVAHAKRPEEKHPIPRRRIDR